MVSEEIRQRMHFRRDLREMSARIERRRQRRRTRDRILRWGTIALLILDAFVIYWVRTRPDTIGW